MISSVLAACRARPAVRPRAALTRIGAVLALGLGLSGCFFNESALVSPFIAAREGVTPIQDEPVVLVAATRKFASLDRQPFFGPERGRGLTFAKAWLTPPDRSITGTVTAPLRSAWAVARLEGIASGSAARALADAANGRDLLLYVHGFNESFQSAVAGAARLADGVAWPGRTALFTWPSGGQLTAYQYDRESAMWSRDALEETFAALGGNASIGRIHVVAHSMGAWLALETLRQWRAAAGDAALSRIGAVVLAAPDIDIDQFEQSVRRLGPLAARITVITAQNDRALAVSARLAGGVARAGLADRERLTALGVTVADASDFGGNWQIIRHDLFLSDPDVRSVIARALERAR